MSLPNPDTSDGLDNMTSFSSRKRSVLTEVEQLRAYRLNKHWTCPRLHRDMRQKGIDMALSTLQHHCGESQDGQSRPTALTRRKMQDYLDYVMPRPLPPQRPRVKRKTTEG